MNRFWTSAGSVVEGRSTLWTQGGMNLVSLSGVDMVIVTGDENQFS